VVLCWVCFHFFDSVKTVLDLGSNDRKDRNMNSVELIEATPSTTLTETLENGSHTLISHLLRAIKNNDLET
jgi:hypothetical protein